MDLDQRRVRKSDRDQEVIPLQAWLAVGEELFIDRLCVIDIGLKLSRLVRVRSCFPAFWPLGPLSMGKQQGHKRGIAKPEPALVKAPTSDLV